MRHPALCYYKHGDIIYHTHTSKNNLDNLRNGALKEINVPAELHEDQGKRHFHLERPLCMLKHQASLPRSPGFGER